MRGGGLSRALWWSLLFVYSPQMASLGGGKSSGVSFSEVSARCVELLGRPARTSDASANGEEVIIVFFAPFTIVHNLILVAIVSVSS